MERLRDGVWVDCGTVNLVGMKMNATMACLRTPEGLLLYSPLAMTPERRAAIDALGDVRHVYAPNTFHHLWVGEWADAYPDAKVHAPPGLRKKRSDLRIDREHYGSEATDFGGAVTEFSVDGFRMEETALLHEPSGTLIVSDLMHNVGRPDDWWAKTYTKMMGFYDEVAMSRVLRWTSFNDKRAAARSLDEIAEREFDAIVFGHGAPIAVGGKEAFMEGAAWLREAK